MGIKMVREQMGREIPLKGRDGTPFWYAMPDPALEMLHQIDRRASGSLDLPENVLNEGTRDRYVQSSLMEEAIRSSQLEGAATTRKVAKEMIRSGREPSTVSERMILNNYRTMQLVRDLTSEPLSPDLVLRLHRAATDRLLPEGGPFRKPGDGIAVYDEQNVLLHRPPPAEQIGERLETMCAFANSTAEGAFLHPIAKAIFLHFWLAYDHPFVDGNGRTARALFYWHALREGFWLFEFVSISAVLRNAPARYGRAFLYTETDGNDLTYFLLEQLRTIGLAIGKLESYVERKAKEVRETAALLTPSADFNHRQLALLSHAVRHPGHRYTVKSHKASHGVVYQTARTDLLDLVEREMLEKTKRGRAFEFVAPPDVGERLRKLPNGAA